MNTPRVSVQTADFDLGAEVAALRQADLGVGAVATFGLEEIRKIPGYHDEPLRGDRKGQRSIRLSRLWRAIYRIAQDGSV